MVLVHGRVQGLLQTILTPVFWKNLKFARNIIWKLANVVLIMSIYCLLCSSLRPKRSSPSKATNRFWNRVKSALPAPSTLEMRADWNFVLEQRNQLLSCCQPSENPSRTGVRPFLSLVFMISDPSGPKLSVLWVYTFFLFPLFFNSDLLLFNTTFPHWNDA